MWLRIQNCFYKVVRDPLFELLIMVCIILNTMFLAVEHHGMSMELKRVLDIGNKVRDFFSYGQWTHVIVYDRPMLFVSSILKVKSKLL